MFKELIQGITIGKSQSPDMNPAILIPEPTGLTSLILFFHTVATVVILINYFLKQISSIHNPCHQYFLNEERSPDGLRILPKAIQHRKQRLDSIPHCTDF